MRCDMGDCQTEAVWYYVWIDKRHVCDAHMKTALHEAEKVGRTLPRAPIDADAPEPEPEQSEAETQAHRQARLAATKGLVEDDLKRKAPRPL